MLLCVHQIVANSLTCLSCSVASIIQQVYQIFFFFYWKQLPPPAGSDANESSESQINTLKLGTIKSHHLQMCFG